MAATTVTMPALGESVVEGTVVKWLAQPGQRVERDQPLVEIATDKANTEIPAPSAGVLVEVIAHEGAVVPVGGPLARLDDASQATAAQPPAPAAASKPAAQPPPQAYAAAPAAQQQPQGGNGHQRASPVVRNVAQEHGVDLERVHGSGPQGRITKADVMTYLDTGGAGPAAVGIVNVDGSADSPEPAVPAGAVSQPPPAQTFPGAPRTGGPATIPPPASSVPYSIGPVPLQLRAYKPPRYTPKEGDQVIPFDHRRRLIA